MSQHKERKVEGEKGEGKRKGGERRKEKTGVWGRQRPDRVRKHPGHTKKKKSDRLGLNFYPSHFLPKKYYNNILPKFTQGFNKRWSDAPNFRSKNLYFRRVFLDPSFILMTS